MGSGDGLGWGGCGLCVGGDAFGEGDGFGVFAPPHFALLQSTGRLTTGAQTLGDFCFGLSGKQLLVSSNTTSFLEGGSHSGSSPLK